MGYPEHVYVEFTHDCIKLYATRPNDSAMPIPEWWTIAELMDHVSQLLNKYGR